MADRYIRLVGRIGLMPETEIESIPFFPVKAGTNTVELDLNAFIKEPTLLVKFRP